MNKLYAFSPITSEEQFDAALRHIAHRAEELSKQLTGTKLNVATVKVFAHYPDEFQFMKGVLEKYGKISTLGRSTSMYVDSSFTIGDNHIKNVGIRVPDTRSYDRRTATLAYLTLLPLEPLLYEQTPHDRAFVFGSNP